MPRRAPPSSLRLLPGPTPPRSTPKHRLPSVPVPALRRPSEEDVRGPPPRQRSGPDDVVVVSKERPRALRGPWDHSGSISISVDVDQLLAPMARAMVVLRA